jgi:DEAD/DEAH box helicase domain-containing protein
MGLTELLQLWKTDPNTAPNIPTWRTLPARPAVFAAFPADLPRELSAALRQRGLLSLYSHQAEAWTRTRAGENIVLATGTASGKTLAYNLPVLAATLENPEARALYLFPTKALAQDQLSVISHQFSVSAAIYDGDTPQSQRKATREKARIILSNPDMLHTGILPHHTNWADFFRSLRFVVIDEMHTYRGVFGSHVANVIRRLKRVARFYGANPQFILTSATIGTRTGRKADRSTRSADRPGWLFARRTPLSDLQPASHRRSSRLAQKRHPGKCAPVTKPTGA